MQNRALRVVLSKLPEPVVSSADRCAAVLGCGHNVDVFKAGFANNPFISDTVQSYSTGITEILATAQLANVPDQVEHCIFESSLNRACQHFILTRAIGPSLVVPKPQRYRVFE